MKIVPIGANVVVRRTPSEEMTSGGIALPDVAKKKTRQGRVLSIGDGRKLPDGRHAPHQVREGYRVLFDSYAGSEVLIDGEELLIMSEDEILAVAP
jgi:chaperonin GroES